MRGDSGYRSIVRRTGGDEPAGIVVVQYPEKEWADRVSARLFRDLNMC